MKAKGHPRLYRRGSIYYHRAAIPKDIAPTYPKKEETFSLKTAERQEALKRVRIAAASVDAKFDAHRRTLASQAKPLNSLTDSQVDHLSRLYYISLLEEDDGVRSDGFMPANDFDAMYDVDWPPSSSPDSERHDFDVHREAAKSFGEDARYLYAKGIIDSFSLEEAADLLTWDGVGISLSEDSPSWRDLARGLQKASIRASEAKQQRSLGEVIETPKAAPTSNQTVSAHSSAVGSGLPPDNGPVASVVIAEWLQEKSREWTPKTLAGHRAFLGYFIAVAGDKPLGQYTKADGRAFKSVLMRLPANWTKNSTLRGLDVESAARRAEALHLPPMSATNVNKYIQAASSFWLWALNNYDYELANPMAGLKVKASRTAREERDPFTPEELEKLFNSTIYTGCQSERKWHIAGPTVLRNSAIYWLPLLALFTGSRMGELLQLYVTDIKQEGDIVFIDINADGPDKSLKTYASKRRIPLHSDLVRLGFLTHVETMRQRGNRRVFPDVEMGGDGYYSSVFSKRFSKVITRLGIKHGQIAFHSFRHNFEDSCRNTGVSSDVMNALQGHTEKGMAGRYGRGFSIDKLAEGIAKLGYPELNLRPQPKRSIQ